MLHAERLQSSTTVQNIDVVVINQVRDGVVFLLTFCCCSTSGKLPAPSPLPTGPPPEPRTAYLSSPRTECTASSTPVLCERQDSHKVG